MAVFLLSKYCFQWVAWLCYLSSSLKKMMVDQQNITRSSEKAGKTLRWYTLILFGYGQSIASACRNHPVVSPLEPTHIQGVVSNARSDADRDCHLRRLWLLKRFLFLWHCIIYIYTHNWFICIVYIYIYIHTYHVFRPSITFGVSYSPMSQRLNFGAATSNLSLPPCLSSCLRSVSIPA